MLDTFCFFHNVGEIPIRTTDDIWRFYLFIVRINQVTQSRVYSNFAEKDGGKFLG
jgi:hypothetical protein